MTAVDGLVLEVEPRTRVRSVPAADARVRRDRVPRAGRGSRAARTVEGVDAGGAGRRPARSWEGLAVAGRTDAGVHATGQVASLDAEGGPPTERARGGAQRGPPRRRARRRAPGARRGLPCPLLRDGRSYRYVVLSRRARAPLARATGALVAAAARRGRARDACAALLVGEHDFTAFTPTETQHEVFRREIRAAGWERRGDEFHFTVTADSFLRHMVRTLVGTMLEPGRQTIGAAARRAPASGGRRDGAAVGAVPRAGAVPGRGLTPEGTDPVDASPRREALAGQTTAGVAIVAGQARLRSTHALPRRPVRPRRHADRLGADHPRLDEARIAHGARPRAGRGARARRDRRPGSDRADARSRPRPGRRARRRVPRAQRAAPRDAGVLRRRARPAPRPPGARAGGSGS